VASCNLDREWILDWLLRTNGISYDAYHQQTRARRAPNTGLWFTGSDEFREWAEGQTRVLWITGIRKITNELYL